MKDSEPYVLTSPDLLAADVRLFQADVDLALRGGGYGSSSARPRQGHAPRLPEPGTKELPPKP